MNDTNRKYQSKPIDSLDIEISMETKRDTIS